MRLIERIMEMEERKKNKKQKQARWNASIVSAELVVVVIRVSKCRNGVSGIRVPAVLSGQPKSRLQLSKLRTRYRDLATRSALSENHVQPCLFSATISPLLERLFASPIVHFHCRVMVENNYLSSSGFIYVRTYCPSVSISRSFRI
jgi:hypothetical protein